jgi:cbb3-type cytochrome oxidase maturation protein
MLSSILMLIILSLFLATGAWLIFLWAVRKGEFDDPEAPKYRMLDDDAALPANQEKRHYPPT